MKEAKSDMVSEVAYCLAQAGILESQGRLQRAARVPILSAPEAAAAALSKIKAIDAPSVHFVGLSAFLQLRSGYGSGRLYGSVRDMGNST